MLEIMLKELQPAAKNFYLATGIKIVLLDEDRQFLFSYPGKNEPFCDEVRKSPALAAGCFDCDRKGLDTCARTHRPYIYNCHMGLTEAVAPIFEGETLIGYMMTGQFLCDTDQKLAEKAILRAVKEHGADAAALRAAFKDCRSFRQESIRAALSLMEMCVSYLHANRIIKSTREDLSAILQGYIRHRYAEPVDSAFLCRMLYISESRLYRLCLQTFGMNLTDALRHRRIEEAKRLLCTTDDPVSRIAEAVGIADSNYFARLFRRTAGESPTEYRQRHKCAP